MNYLESIPDDQFVDIPGYEGRYAINKSGIVVSIPRFVNRKYGNPHLISSKQIALSYNKRGYPRVWLIDEKQVGKTLTIHRLVAKTFIPNPENKPQVNHKDGNKLNNNITNLEWSTRSENMKHAFETGLFRPKLGALNGMFGKRGKLAPGFGKRGKESYSYGRGGELSVSSKIILDKESGIFYFGVTEAAQAKSIKPFTLYPKLNGRRKNDTSLMYV